MRVFLVFAAACVLAAPVSAADVYPTRPIRIVVPFPAGGPADALARMVGDKLQASLGQPVVVDNRPGAGGNIGMDLVAKSPADGYTLVLGSFGPRIISPFV